MSFGLNIRVLSCGFGVQNTWANGSLMLACAFAIAYRVHRLAPYGELEGPYQSNGAWCAVLMIRFLIVFLCALGVRCQIGRRMDVVGSAPTTPKGCMVVVSSV